MMKSNYLLVLIFLAATFSLNAQYEFTDDKSLYRSSVKNQQRTGTCWSFATASFIESELVRQGKGDVNLSEMYVVRNVYNDKARNYMLRQGKANFSEGSLSHDLIRMIKSCGVVPENVYSGLPEGKEVYDHSEMAAGLKGFLDGVRGKKKLSDHWQDALSAIMDSYMGEVPSEFVIHGKKYTPQTYAESLNIKVDDYVSLTSFNHHPYYESFILEIPDNYSNGAYYNVPLEEMVDAIDYAVNNGYTIAWDGDVSEKGFSSKQGIAILPTDEKRSDLFENPGEEVVVNQENRQKAFESYSTTDDHLMHIVGTATDQEGNRYYIIKNSWGEIGPYDGYLYMSEAYLKMKTVAVMVHKDAIPDKTSQRLFVYD